MTPVLACASLGCLLLAFGACSEDGKAAMQNTEQQGDYRLFELRTYTAHPGKMEALHDRFRDHTLGFFEKHGIEVLGYWTPTEGDEADNTLIYVVAYPDRASRDRIWKGFLTDPEWQKVVKESRKNGWLVKTVVDSMAPHLREILLLSYFQRLSYNQIADNLQIPLGTVKSRLHTAVAAFAKAWKAAMVREGRSS